MEDFENKNKALMKGGELIFSKRPSQLSLKKKSKLNTK